MPSNLNAPSPSAVMLAALLLCAHGASIGNAPTDGPLDDSSGETEEENPTEETSVFKPAIGLVINHQTNFAGEFHNVVSYDKLDDYELSQLPKKCPSSNFSKEACLKSVVEGLQAYIVLLKFVESQYPNNATVYATRLFTENLTKELAKMMKNPQQITALTRSQEELLLNSTKSFPDAFSRKMAANSILKNLRTYLIHNERLIVNRKKARLAKRNAAPARLNYQLLDRSR